MRFSDELKQQIIEAYKGGESQSAIARRLGLYSASVSRIVRGAELKVRQRNDPITNKERAEISRLYQAGKPVTEIAAAVERSKAGVTRIINELGIMRPRGETRRRRVDTDVRDLAVAKYLGGQTVEEVSSETGLSKGVIYGELRRRGVSRRSMGRRSRFHNEPQKAQEIITAYKNGCSVSLLADVFKCSRDAIKQVLIEAEVEIRKEGRGQRVYQYVDRKQREHWMRSTWEIKTAIHLDAQERDWDFEKESFEIAPRRRYTPDFWIYADGELEILVDVKGWLYPASDDRIKLFRKKHPDLPFELWGQKELSEKSILNLEMSVPESKARSGLRSRVSKAEIQEAVRLYESGMTTGLVAEALNRSESAIARHLQRLGKTRDRHQTKLMLSANQKTRDRIAEVYLEGNSMAKTAEILAISRDVVAREVKSRGISRKRRRSA